ncbi:MAG: hypothetical protein ACRD5K_12905 [Candidatus Acidiferrales bacterium]
MKTFLVPDAWNAFEGINFVAAVEELDFLDFSDAACGVELLGLELVVVLPGFQKLFEESAVGDAHVFPDFEFSLI